MNLSWGKGIFSAYAIFILGVFVMVTISVTRNIDLVTPNYYEKELKYQEEIDRINNTNKLKEQISFEITANSVLIKFPHNSKSNLVKGEIVFFRPSDSRKDFRMNVEPDSDFSQLVDITKLESGLWKIKIFWDMDGIEYLSSTNFMKP